MSELFARVRDDADVDGVAPALRLRRPSWRDRRLLVGLVLVLGSTLLGARLLSDGTGTAPVWALARDLAAGSVLTDDDLRAVPVHLAGSADRYLDATAPPPVGRVLAAAGAEGDLLAGSALRPVGGGPATRTVSVPVEQWHLPGDLRRGELVDVYVTPEGSAADGSTSVVARSVVVAGVEGGQRRFGAGGSSEAVLLTVAESDVARLVAGLSRGTVDVVRVPAAAAGEVR